MLNSSYAHQIQFVQKLIPHNLLSPAAQNLSGCLAFMAPPQEMEGGQHPADNVPCHMEVLLAIKRLIFDSNSQTISSTSSTPAA